MNTKEQNIVLNKLKLKANNDFKKSQLGKLSELIKLLYLKIYIL